MMRQVFCSVLVGMCVLAGQVRAVRGGVEIPADGMPDIVVATVTKVSEEPATNGKPAHVELDVSQVVRGKAKVGSLKGTWDPPGHGNDMGMAEPPKGWTTTPMEKPKVGEKFILFGWIRDSGEGSVLRTHGQGRTPFTDAALEATQKHLRKMEADEKANAERAAAEQKALEKDRANWRAGVSAEDITKQGRESDFVAIATVYTGTDGYISFRVEQILKGKRRDDSRGDYYFLYVQIGVPVSRLLERDAKYLLFLREDGFDEGKSPRYVKSNAGDGIVKADKVALKAAQDAIKATATAPATQK